MGSGYSDPEERTDRDDETGGVGQEGDGCRQQANEQAADGWPTDLGHGLADLEPCVGLDQVLPAHETREVGHVGDVEKYRSHALGHGDNVELGQRQQAEGVRQRHRSQHAGAKDVSRDHYRPATHPVDPHACGQADHQEGRVLGRRQQADLESGGVQQRDRGKGKGQDRYLAPEDAHGLAKPKAPEASVTDQALAVRPL